MAWAKETRIKFMIGLCTLFLVTELGVGYWVGSLALIADGFHMLNDIISLCVGLWALSVSRQESTDKYSYGWLRAEILGANFNAIFLLGLCVTILLGALERFFEPKEISLPVPMLVVGGMGLLSNLIGFFVLSGHSHDHAHDQEGNGHAHGDEHNHDNCHDELTAAEEGLATQVVDAGVGMTAPSSSDLGRHISFDTAESAQERSRTLERCSSRGSGTSRGRQRGRASSSRHRGITSIDDISIYPSSFRQDIQYLSINQSPDVDEDTEPESENHGHDGGRLDVSPPDDTESSPLLQPNRVNGDSATKRTAGPGNNGHRSLPRRGRSNSGVHDLHYHNKPRTAAKSSHGHSHGDMGMHALILHVIGDAVGNVGVIITAIIIWKWDSPLRFYADPIVSLLIAFIIFRTTYPLAKSTALILLQATPDHIDVNEIKSDIESLNGVVHCHHIHVWQLSDTKLVCSMHMEVAYPITEGGGEKYMALSRQARKCLHAYGIHSSTIQAEFGPAPSRSRRISELELDGPTVEAGAPLPSCRLDCVDDCDEEGCCIMGSRSGSSRAASTRSASSLRPIGGTY